MNFLLYCISTRTKANLTGQASDIKLADIITTRSADIYWNSSSELSNMVFSV